MTFVDAIHELQVERNLYESDVCWAGDGTPDGNIMLAIDIGIEALEKQIPKKPQDCNGERMCECGNIVKTYQKYCMECGQAIDWSEEK